MRSGSRLETSASGVADFDVVGKMRSCTLRPDSRVRMPDGRAPIGFESGTTVCMTSTGELQTIDVGSDVHLDVPDPVFAVSVKEGGADVRVFRGFVRVWSEAQPQDKRIVGPDQRVAGGGPVPVGPQEALDREHLPPEEQQIVKDLEAQLQPPDLSLPVSDPTLEAIRKRKVLEVAVDQRVDRQSEQFIDKYLDLLQDRWGLTVQRSKLTAQQADDSLGAGRLDLFVSPAFVPSARPTPFFVDSAQRTWLLQVGDQAASLQGAIQTFLLGALDIGEYGSRFVQAFGRQPTYKGVEALVFRKPGAAATSSEAPPGNQPTGSAAPPSPRGPSPGPTSSSPPTPSPSAPAFRVTGASLTANPPSYSGACPTRFTFSGTISASGAGTVHYRFLRSDGGTDTIDRTLTFSGAGSQTVSTTWDIGGAGMNYSGWEAIQVVDPTPQIESNHANFTLDCLSPSPVTGAQLSVSPPSYNGVCPTRFTFTGTITVSGPATVRYKFLRSDGAIDTIDRTLTFSGAGSQTVSTTWDIGGAGMNYSGWEAIQVVDPTPQIESNHANFTLSCSQPPG